MSLTRNIDVSRSASLSSLGSADAPYSPLQPSPTGALFGAPFPPGYATPLHGHRLLNSAPHSPMPSRPPAVNLMLCGLAMCSMPLCCLLARLARLEMFSLLSHQHCRCLQSLLPPLPTKSAAVPRQARRCSAHHKPHGGMGSAIDLQIHLLGVHSLFFHTLIRLSM
jgi:hypothetical protein